MTVDRDGKLTLSYAETNAEARKRLYAKVKSIVGDLDMMNPAHLVHRFAYMKNETPRPAARTRRGRAGSVPTRPTRC